MAGLDLRALGAQIDQAHQQHPDAEPMRAAVRARLTTGAGDPAGVRQLGAALNDAHQRTLAEQDTLREVRSRLLRPRRPARRRPSPAVWAAPAGALALAALLLFALRVWPPATAPVLRCVVEGPTAALAVTPGQRVIDDLRFSDGSSVALRPRSTARLLALREHGADVRVERGELAVHVVPAAANRWRFQAGPFDVHVLGTRFEVAWDPEQERFSLALHRGKVRIEGPTIGRRVVQAGESVSVWLKQGRVEQGQASSATLARQRDVGDVPGARSERPAPDADRRANAAGMATRGATGGAPGTATGAAAGGATNREASAAGADVAPGSVRAATHTPGTRTQGDAATRKRLRARGPEAASRSREAGTGHREAASSSRGAASLAREAASSSRGAASLAREVASDPDSGPDRGGAPAALAPEGDDGRGISTGGEASPARQGQAAAQAVPDAPPSPLALARAGRHTEALHAAERLGWSNWMAQSDPAALVVLADAARFARDVPRAVTLYSEARRRAPGTGAAAAAALALGRLAFDHHRDYRAAAAWLQRYLSERPEGPLVREASGRLLEAWLKAGDRRKACDAAGGYLLRFSTGPHAALARETLAGCGAPAAEAGP